MNIQTARCSTNKQNRYHFSWTSTPRRCTLSTMPCGLTHSCPRNVCSICISQSNSFVQSNMSGDCGLLIRDCGQWHGRALSIARSGTHFLFLYLSLSVYLSLSLSSPQDTLISLSNVSPVSQHHHELVLLLYGFAADGEIAEKLALSIPQRHQTLCPTIC